MKINNSYVRNLAYLVVMIAASMAYELARKYIKNTIISIIDYIIRHPFVGNRNSVINILLGRYFKSIIAEDGCYNIIIPLGLCIRIVSVLYKHIFAFLAQMIDLLNNRTYNPYMKRYDTIHLQTDQIALVIVLTAVLLIIFANVIALYMLFAILYFITEGFLIAWELFDNITSDGSQQLTLVEFRYRRKCVFGRMMRLFTGDLFIAS